MEIQLPTGVILTVHNKSVAQQYLKHGATKVVTSPVKKTPKKRSANKSATKVASASEAE